MKLSEMSTDRVRKVMVEIAEPMERIGNDEVLNDKLRALAARKRMTRVEQYASMFGMLVPLLLERHIDDTYAVLAAMTGKTVEEISGQNVLVTMREARESIDADFLRFFGWSVSTADAK